MTADTAWGADLRSFCVWWNRCEKRDGGYFGKLIVNGKYIEDYDKWFEENYSDPVDWIQ